MKRLTFLFLCLYILPAYAQNTLQPNIYFQNMNYYNPAAGLSDTLTDHEFSLYGRYKFIDNNEVWKKPATVFLNHIGRSVSTPGFYSIGYSSDRYSFYDRHSLYTGYTYQWKIGGIHMINAGIRGVLNFDYIRWKKLVQEENPARSHMYFTPDIDMGIQYQVKKFMLGLSSKNVFANTKKTGGEILLKNQREWYSTISYTFGTQEKITFTPYTLLYLERRFMYDAGVNILFFNRVNASYIFRLKEFRHVLSLRGDVYKGFQAGIAIDRSQIYRDVNLDVLLGYRF